VGGVHDVITCAEFKIEIFMGYILQGVEFSIFPLILALPVIGRPSMQRRVVLNWLYSPRAVGTTLSELHALHRVRVPL